MVDYAKTLSPTHRGEIEIGQINQLYLSSGKLFAHLLEGDTVWLDLGSPGGLLRGAEFVERTQRTTGAYVGCIEEWAWKQGYLDLARLRASAIRYQAADYGQYLLSLMDEGDAL